ncbi:MAG TPA: hypothetical protein VKF36_03135 [Syntrophorhabdales bacterium]|nr:hypothetical protein [Syntrophorhabdales bacterium]
MDNVEDIEMDHGDDYKYSADNRRAGEPGSGQEKASGKIATATKAIRAITAIVVFGVPLVTGTATLLGYGVYKAYKRIKGGS